jgi:hypothetical protein
MMPYTKLFSSILQSTIWLENSDVKVVWITLLAMADRDGRVEASVPGLAKTAGVDRSACERALSLFLAPDPDSRTKINDGRRIEEIPGGWRLLNYETYRERLSVEERRARDAQRQRRKRERDAVAQGVMSRDASQAGVTSPTNHAIAEADTEADQVQDQGAREAPRPSSAAPTVVRVQGPTGVSSQQPDPEIDDPGTEVQATGKKLTPAEARFERFWASYPNKTGKKAAFRVWERLKVSDAMTDTLIAAVEQQKTWPAWTKDFGSYIPHPTTWLNQGRWDDEPPTPARAATNSPVAAGNAEASRRFLERLQQGGGQK